ncbi:MAG: hypothetical protein IPM60_03515 [Rhodospirillales bacterium]|nr:hypothetical protein [Rhodospirillales bacterium]
MSTVKFTDEEMAQFVACFERCPTWARWGRSEGAQGDVLEITVAGRRPATLRLTKSHTRGYLAIGFDGWGLTVCDDFSEMLGILSGFGFDAATLNLDAVAA